MAAAAAVAVAVPPPPSPAAASGGTGGDADDKSPEPDEARALQEANALLRRIGFGARQFARFEDLVASASSMSVALYEKLFQLRLERVERTPRSLAHYEANAQRVLDALSTALLEAPLPREEDGGDGSDAGVTGAALCAGDVRAIRHVVRMFEHVLSLLAAASITPLPARARKKGAVRKTRKLRTSRSQQQQQRQSRSFGSGSESDNAREARSTRRVMMQSGGAATRRQGRSQQQQQQQQRDDANLYETSDASITRSRVGELPSRRRTLDGADRQRSDYDARNLMHDDEDEAADPSLLLETQKYGRFVPVAASRSRHASSRRGSDGASGNEADDGAQGPVNDEDAQEEELMYFGGVSSVSSGSRSDESVHFIEEDDGDASRDFSSSNVVDLQNIPPRNSLSPSNAYDEPRHFDRSNGAPTDSKSALQQPQETQKPNQEAEEMVAEVASGADKKLPSRKPPSKSVPDRQPTGTRTRVRDPASSLYPLLPKKSAATSKSQAEYTRYKLFLKDHLQDLRQREYCQRQHLERACKVGEHTANVEKIRARRFQQDIRLQRIAIGLEAKNEEEKHLRHTLTHILELEKAKLRDEHRTTASILKQIQKDHLDREVAMETFYANQIELVKERTHREVHERELVQKAHRLASEQMVREMRRERERQVSALLQEKQHLEEARRFRAAATLSSALERGDDARARASQTRVDAFYTAAMKARQHNAQRGGRGAGATSVARKASKQAATTYASVRPAPANRRAR